MIGEILAAVKGFLSTAAPWVIIAPWEQSVRVRFGKYVRRFESGIHFKLPYFDRFFVQSVRTRISDLGRQTLSTADGKVVTVSGVVEYEIRDIEALYMSLHHAEDTIVNCARSALMSRISTMAAASASHMPPIEAFDLDLLTSAGVHVRSIRLTDCATVRTYRLIGDKDPYRQGDNLETEDWRE